VVQFVPTSDLKQKFFFNVSTPVGAGAKGSNRADILLVQFFFVLRQDFVDGNRDLYRKISMTGICDEDLIAAIRAYQASHADRLTQDGLVSRAQGARISGGPAWRTWTIVGMNFGFWAQCYSLWPRLDKHPKCNAELGRIVRETLGAVPPV